MVLLFDCGFGLIERIWLMIMGLEILKWCMFFFLKLMVISVVRIFLGVVFVVSLMYLCNYESGMCIILLFCIVC